MEIKLTNVLPYKWKEIFKFFMRTFLLLCCTTVFSFSSDNLFSQDAKVTIDADKTLTIFEVFELIGKQTECTFIYQSDIFNDVPEAQLKTGVIEVMTLLSQCLPTKNFEINSNKDNLITISRKSHKTIQQKKIEVKGVIKDINGMPVAGVSVQIKNTYQGTISDFDGSYGITAQATDSLVFSALGFMTQTVPIDGRSVIDIILLESITALDTIVLNAGYYKVSEREQTGSIVKVTQSDIEKQTVANPLEALQGRVSGVEINQTSGVTGAGFNIKIRGQNSIRDGGNDPLYIIDGVPYASSTLGTQQASNLIPELGISPLNNINPKDIESIEILKDADATAIYGSRGANGVVLITTKKGKFGDTKVVLNVSSSLGVVSNTLETLTTAEYLAMRREAYANDGIDPIPFDAYDINGTWDETRNTDWQEVLTGSTSYLTNFQGSISGGTEKTQFLVSANVRKQTSVYPKDYENNILSGLVNLSHTTNDEKLNLQFSSSYTSNNNTLPGDPLLNYTALILPPNAPELYNDDGSLNWENSTWRNPLSRLEGLYESNGSTLISNLVVEYAILKNLRFKTNFGFTESRLKEIRTEPSTVFDPAFGLGAESSYAVHNASDRSSWIVEPQILYNTSINKLKIESLVGLTFQDQKDNQFSQFAFGFSNNNFIESISAASSFFAYNDIQSVYRYQAAFGRVNFNLADKYIVNLTGRRDGSSRFGTNKRFSNFAAIGAAWLFSRERIIKDAFPFLSFGKLKASYGTSGNDQIGNYQYLDTYSFGFNQYQNTIGLFPTGLFNPDFSWESNKKLEASLNLGFFKDRLLVGSNYYRNRSSNQLVGIPLPTTTGFSSINANLDATVENKGWEFELSSVNIQTTNFRWSTSLNITFPKNKLLEFPNLEGSTYANDLVVGEPINIRKVYQLNGVNPTTGLYEFEDFNGDGQISNPEDRQIIKDLNPKYFGGFSNTFTFKQLKLDILVNFSKQLGFNYWNLNTIPGSMANQPREVLSRWQNAGDQSNIQRFSSGLSQEAFQAYQNFTESDAAISDASFIRLKTLSLSYQLFKENTKVLGCEIFIRGHNLWTITNYFGLDPETRNSQALPPLRFITIGTQLTF